MEFHYHNLCPKYPLDVSLGFFHKMKIIGLKTNVVTIATTHTTYAKTRIQRNMNDET